MSCQVDCVVHNSLLPQTVSQLLQLTEIVKERRMERQVGRPFCHRLGLDGNLGIPGKRELGTKVGT